MLAYRLHAPAPAPAAPLSGTDARRLLARADRLMQASGRTHLLLLGAEPALLEHAQLQTAPVLIVETRLEQARFLRQAFPALSLLADTSPWSLLLLLAATGWLGGHVQPLLAATTTDTGLQRLSRLVQAVRPLALPASPALEAWPSLSLAAILHPDEPGLEHFFAQIPSPAPAWLRELVLVWDAESPPASLPALSTLSDLPFPIRQMAHPLATTDGGFGHQRTLALAQCTGDWVLFLDADERLAPEAWAALPACMHAPDIAGWWLPRETLHPDADHCLIGYGLWPDLQLRLFRRLPGLRFEGVVHERLCGLEQTGQGQAIACALHIRHEQRLHKTREALAAKLDRFNTLDARQQHRLGDDYPTLQRARLHAMLQGAPWALRLP
ncbi:glycosyltransferase family 2 protein [Megalodesulfovibrio paquesii]